jgi:D-alanine-D-alanine ligase-like ATP-grasp enzyme
MAINMNEVSTLEQISKFKITTRLLMQEAFKKGYKISYFKSSPSTISGITKCEKNGRELFFRSTLSSLTDSYGVFAAENKSLTHTLLSSNGVSTPETISLGDGQAVEDAFDFLDMYKKVVVKPANTNHGEGITIGVTNKTGLKKAISLARDTGNGEVDVIIQKQIEGDEFRFLVVEGKVIAVASRRPPMVIGDGKSTIRELIRQKNQDPQRGFKHAKGLTLIDVDEVQKAKGVKFLGTILSKGECAAILDVSNLSKGGEAVDFTDKASSTLKELAIKAAKHCFLGIAGVDIMTKDITSNSTKNSFVIEVNLTPGIRMHQFPSEGKPRDVAKIIFESFEKTSRPIAKQLIIIGRSERVILPDLSPAKIPAKIDTGADWSSIWAHKIVSDDQNLNVTFFGPRSKYYTGRVHVFSPKEYSMTRVANSFGQKEIRYKIKLKIFIEGRLINGTFTLADRSTKLYPILLGRSLMNGKFVIDVSKGNPLIAEEKARKFALEKELRKYNKKGLHYENCDFIKRASKLHNETA